MCICLVVLSGCAKRASVVAARIEVGDQAPEFVLQDIFGRGEIVSGDVFRDNHATVVVIWSLACPTCREALIEVQEVYAEYHPQAVAFLGINYDKENIQGVRAFVKSEGIGFTTLWDSASRAARAYRALDYTFSFFVVDSDGIVTLAQYDHPPGLAEILAGALEHILQMRL